jgi:hypothetical protein
VTKLKIIPNKYDGNYADVIKTLVFYKKEYVFIFDEVTLKSIENYLKENRGIVDLHIGEENHLLSSTAYISTKSLNERILQKIDFM